MPSGHSLLLGAAGFALWLPASAWAQGQEEELAQPATVDQGEAETGNYIVVTATKREKTLQDTPVAVSVATAEQIERARSATSRICNRSSLRSRSRNCRVPLSPISSSAASATVRTTPASSRRSACSSTASIASRTASQIGDLPNVERVEVLRGPQSTLFGKNASAGVISIVTQEPQFDFGGSMEATYGNYNAMVLRGYVTGPVSDTVALSIAGGYNRRDGYNKDLTTGDSTNDRNRWFVRGQMLFEPSADLKIRLIADYGKIDEICCGVVNLQRSPATDVINLLGGQVTDPNDPYANVVYNNRNSTNKVENYGVSGHVEYNVGPLQLTSITSYRSSQNVTSQDADFSSADLINPISANVQLDTFTQEFRASAEFADIFSALLGVFYINEDVNQTGSLLWGSQARTYADILVQSLSGGALSLIGSGPSPVPLEGTFGALEGDPTKYAGTFFAAGTGNHEQFTLGSEALSIFGQLDVEVANGLTLTLGGNFTHDKKDYSASINSTDVFSKIDFDSPYYAPFREQLLYQGGLAQQVGNALMLGRSATQAEILAFASDPVTGPIFATQIQPAVAAYADGNKNNPAANPLNPLRAVQYLPPFLAVPNSVEDGKISDDDFSYTIRLAYDVSPNVNLYASYATGFKAASVNLSRDSKPLLADMAALSSAGLLQVNQAYGTRFADPEESTVIEAGFKGSWRGASANVAVFQQEIKGFQSNIFTGSGFQLVNAGKQSTFGVEFEGQAELVPGFTASLGVTYLDPVYDEFVFSAVGDLSGTTPAGIPNWTVVLGGQYDYEFANGDNLILNATYHHESEHQIVDGLPGFLSLGDAAAIAAAAQFTREVNEVDASITFAMASGVELSVWGRNLTDDRYLLSLFDSVAQPFSISGYTNQPRTFGGTVRYRW